MADVEAEAQAQYKAKLTKEQNVCLAQNSGANPNPTFVWAKLKGKLPSDYATNGMGNRSVESNDLYNSFCRVKVTLQSEDHDVNKLLNGETVTIQGSSRQGAGGAISLVADLFGGGESLRDGLVADLETKVKGTNASAAYFSAGDAFTCGSWVSSEGLNKISEMVGAKARKDAGEGSQSDYNTRLWTTLGVGVLGAGASAWGYDKLQSSSSLGGLLNSDLNKTNAADEATDLVAKARTEYNKALTDKNQATMDKALDYARQAKSKLVAAGLSDAEAGSTTVSGVELPSRVLLTTEKGEELTAAQDAKTAVFNWDSNEKLNVLGIVSDIKNLSTRYAATNSSDASTIETALAEITTIVNAAPTSAGDTTDSIKTRFDRIVTILDGTGFVWKTEKNGTVNTYDRDTTWKANLKPRVDAMKLHSVQTSAAQAAVAATYGPSTKVWDSNSGTLDQAITDLTDACNKVSNEDSKTKQSGQKKRIVGDVIAGAVGGVTTAAITNGIVASAQKAKYENAENEAVKKWMEDIGSKIHCYIGGQLVGDFGDIVTVNITED